jgi:hypothetical protein
MNGVEGILRSLRDRKILPRLRPLEHATRPAGRRRYQETSGLTPGLEYWDGAKNLLDMFHRAGRDRGYRVTHLVGIAGNHSRRLCQLVDRLPQSLVRLTSLAMKQKIQIVLLVTLAVVGARTAYIFHERRAAQNEPAVKTAAPLNPDYYVTPKKLRPYDLKSARQLTQQPVWAQVGYAYTYYPYDVGVRGVNFAHEAGQLLPLEELRIKDVITANASGGAGRQVMAVFEKQGKAYAFSIGTVSDGDYHFYSDDMLYIQDPHQLYNHWPADVWDAIDKHQVKPGMNELQVGFSIGLGIPEGSGAPGDRTLDYANGGKPLRITYRNGKVEEIHTGTQ